MCPGIFVSRAYAQYGVTQNYNYRYNVEDPDTVRNGNGVPHVSELGAIWGNGNDKIQNLMQKYWTSFIKTFDPNSARDPGSPTWEKWTADQSNTVGLKRLLVQGGTQKTEVETVSVGQRTRCDVLLSWGISLKQ